MVIKKSPTSFFSWYRSEHLVRYILILVLIATFFSTTNKYLQNYLQNIPSSNQLVSSHSYTGKDAYLINLAKPVNFNGLTSETQTQIRSEMVAKHNVLLEGGSYVPTSQVFSAINYELPWYSIQVFILPATCLNMVCKHILNQRPHEDI